MKVYLDFSSMRLLIGMLIVGIYALLLVIVLAINLLIHVPNLSLRLNETIQMLNMIPFDVFPKEKIENR